MERKETMRLPLAEDPGFLSSLADLDRGLSDRSAEPPRSPDVASVPIVTAPGQRPLLDLFSVFFPSQVGAPVPSGVSASGRAHRTPLADQTFFRLLESPFALPADPKFLFRNRAHERAAEEVIAALERGDRVIAVTGAPGIGKTLLCRTIVDRLDRRSVTSLVADPVASVEELLKTLLADFGVMSRDSLMRGRLSHGSRGEFASALHDFLASLSRLQASAVVIVDAAQNLPMEALRELGALVETARFGEFRAPRESRSLLQLILVGEPELLPLLSQPVLQPLSRHVSTRSVLGPLERDEVGSYVLHRLAVAGNPHVDFDDTALSRVADLSYGAPRLVNLLCDRAMDEAHRFSTSVIDLPSVELAAHALDLTPPPSAARSLWRAALLGLTFTLLVLLGAAAATYVFRSEIAAILAAS